MRVLIGSQKAELGFRGFYYAVGKPAGSYSWIVKTTINSVRRISILTPDNHSVKRKATGRRCLVSVQVSRLVRAREQTRYKMRISGRARVMTSEGWRGWCVAKLAVRCEIAFGRIWLRPDPKIENISGNHHVGLVGLDEGLGSRQALLLYFQFLIMRSFQKQRYAKVSQPLT